MTMQHTFNLDGTLSRKRKTACKQCGAMEECDVCWEHVSDWSPFYIWHCLLCGMPKSGFMTGCEPQRCEFCGWDEAVECKHIDFEFDGNGEAIPYETKYDPETREVISRTRQVKK